LDMSEELWSAVDDYLAEKLIHSDPVLEEALRANAAAGLPAIDVAPNQGKLLNLLARMSGAKRILEIGTLGGYSTIWLARALPADGKLISLEFEAKHADVARANIERAGLSHVAEVRIGPAAESLAHLVSEDAAPFDFIFIDANKESYPEYLEWSLRLARVGAAIVADNVVREGALIDAANTDIRVQGVRRFIDTIAANRRFDATAVQTVGSKGYDGFVLAIVQSDLWRNPTE
jgi:predicted O-methyltransferase YrrM